MKDHYLTHHYAHINRIDPASEASVRAWLQRSEPGYHRELGPYLKDVKGKRILELGCGLGGTLHYLAERGAASLTGVDHSDEQLDVCRRFVTTNVETADAVEFLERNGEPFDHIIALDLIEHLPKTRTIPFLTAAHQRLAPGGTLILRTPNMGSLFGLRSRYIDFTHETGFTEESLQQVLREAGFTAMAVNNSYIGARRLAAVRTFQWLLGRLYNIPLSTVVTANLLATARR